MTEIARAASGESEGQAVELSFCGHALATGAVQLCRCRSSIDHMGSGQNLELLGNCACILATSELAHSSSKENSEGAEAWPIRPAAVKITITKIRVWRPAGGSPKRLPTRHDLHLVV